MHGSILFRFLRIHFFSHFESFLKLLKKGRNGQKGVILVWHVVVWTPWRTQNERIFSDKVVAVVVVEIVDRIKNCYWKWILAKKNNTPCAYFINGMWNLTIVYIYTTSTKISL
jgi:hypothetical protein